MKVAVDFFRAETMANLKTVGEYYRRMEDQLGLLRETKEAFLRADCKNWDEWDAESAGFEWTFNQLFPRCLRYSFVVLLYSVVETKLTAFCKELSKRRKVPCPDWNGRKFSLEKCKPFLSKTTGINLKNTLAWNK